MKQQLSVPQWLDIPMKLRMELAKIFSVPRSANSIVEGNIVKSDGYTHDDLLNISVEKMQAYIFSKDPDFFNLLNMVLDKIQNKTPDPVSSESPFQTLSSQESEQFRNEYNQRQEQIQNDKKNAEETKRNENAPAATSENQGAAARRGRPKKGSSTSTSNS